MNRNFVAVLIIGSIFELTGASVLAQSREVKGRPAEQVSDRMLTKSPRFHLSLFGGLSFPTGKFAGSSDAESGYAKTGYAIGAEGNLNITGRISWISTLDLSVNPTDMSSIVSGTSATIDVGSWSNVWLLTGVSASGPVAPESEITVSAAAQIGLLFGTSPGVKMTYGSEVSNQASASSTTLGYGLGVGISAYHITLGLRYLGGLSPRYSVTATSSTGSVTGSHIQPTSCLQLLIGIVL